MVVKKNKSARFKIRSGKKLFTITSLVICLILGAWSATSDVNPLAEDDHTESNVSETIQWESASEPIPTAISEESTPIPNRSDLQVITVMPKHENPENPRNSPPIMWETPEEILVQILADLVQRAGVDDQNIRVIWSQSVTWNDGSLGCPKPGRFYTQALVDGYWVILQVGGVYYDYRVSESGHFSLCGGGGKISISPPDKTLLDK